MMAVATPLVSVVIPHLNQPNELDACLVSLHSQTLDRSLFEVIVVDNGSEIAPILVVERHRGTVLLSETRPGPGPARNRGAAAARGSIFCFIDADCRADPHWLEAALKSLNAAPPHTVLGGDVRIWRENSTEFTAIEAYESVFAYRFKLYIEQQGYSGTGNLVVRREDLEAVGPFKGLEVAEDVEWGGRARAAGMTIRYEPSMIVYHPARRSLRELFVKWDRHIQHDLYAARGKPRWLVKWLVRACMVAISPLIHSAEAITSDRLNGYIPRLKAIAVLTASRLYRAWRMLTILRSKRGVAWNRPAA
jgi:glycosyltransferase involved in cell wall biosynthesis